MRSGVNVDILAQVKVDEPGATEILFYQDEAGHHLAATVRRDEIAGLILGPQKAGAISSH
jgi:hypothetical protein